MDPRFVGCYKATSGEGTALRFLGKRCHLRNFHKIGDVNAGALLHQVVRHPELWNQNTFRTQFPSTPHVDVDDIWLRFADADKSSTTTRIIGDTAPIWYPPAKVLTEAKLLILNLMRAVEAYELGRVLITRIRPGGQILPHRDNDGEYVHAGDVARYHMVLQGFPGSLYTCGEPDEEDVRCPDVETVNMKTGEIWWFNAHKLHHVVNNSVDDRIHLIVDVRTW